MGDDGPDADELERFVIVVAVLTGDERKDHSAESSGGSAQTGYDTC